VIRFTSAKFALTMNHPARIARVGALCALLAACSSNAPAPVSIPWRRPTTAVRWIPSARESYQIQYDGRSDLSVRAAIYDLDLFDTPASTVRTLHAMGRHVVCYVDVGTWEDWRPDAKEFRKSVLGKPDGRWPGERWLDIRQTSVLEPIMESRFQLCKRKGFDAMDPDNIDGYANDTGFPLTYAEQLTYDTWVASAAHALGLTADEKGDVGQVEDLVKVFDFAVVEQCYAQGWCSRFSPYTRRNRLVVDVEYGIGERRFLRGACPLAAQYRETAILKRLALTAWRVACP
jgi:hypothetical protein